MSNIDDEIPVQGRSRVEGRTITDLHHYRAEIFYVAIDKICVEMDHRFSEGSNIILDCFSCLDPKNSFSKFDVDKLARFADIYHEDFSDDDHGTIRNQLETYVLQESAKTAELIVLIMALELAKDKNFDKLWVEKDLSYDQMPSILKQCFVYFSLYPKDHIFNSLAMCELWVALGLVQSRNGREKLEHVARKYIDELHSRSFIQDVNDLGFFCQFKVHHLIQDLALYVAGDEFVAVNSQTRHIPQQARHLSFVVEDKSFDHALFPESRSVRSIQFPIRGMGLESESVLNTWLSKYKYLRYLNLSNSSFETVPKSIAKLEHLCFLNISLNQKIRTLPNSICELLNLQVLSFQGCTKLEELPKGLGKLISLRILCVSTKQSTLPYYEFASLNNLQTLIFKDCVNLKFLFEHPLPSVEKLHCISCESLESLPLNTFPKLQTLYIHGCQMLNLSLENENSIQKLRMKHLYLIDFPKLLTLPQWIVCAGDTLETFYIIKFPNLQMLPEYLTTMTRLKRIGIISCSQLLSLPTSGWDHLTVLDDLFICECPELYQKCQPHSGEYWPMIRHIKNLHIEEGEKEEE
ncbi:putative disease resistance RPP13-like protein 3 [Vicia villosa]|uniref:putative disease resistance RPP13-like protein 3 n=1 Tax=Vicia villosa TaxID=3911 RepID=UPI00273C65D8|nr:putative disease resistance RPP13-like protein 3 [Vicia villosa]